MDSDQRLNELFQRLTNFERTRTGAAAWSLDNMHQLLAEIPEGDPSARWVQVAGSKGKGTTVAYLEHLARAAGKRTGAFVSPHLEHVTERVRIDGEPVEGEVLVAAMEKVLASAAAHAMELSFFEAIAAAAVRIFREQRVDFVALEVGLGGRLDATTAVPVDAVVLTRIELEHTEILGDTLELIATEKAHTIRPGKPVFLEPETAVAELFGVHAATVGAEAVHEVRVVNPACDVRGWSGQVETKVGEEVREEAFQVADASRFELPAMALATACLRALYPDGAFSLLPVPRPPQPGRFEVVAAGGVQAVLDGAHTPASTAEVVGELDRRFQGREVVLLFASARDKKWQEALKLLLPRVASVVVTEAEGTPSVSAVELAADVRRAGRSVRTSSDPAAAWRAARDLLAPDGLLLVTGSFYLVGAVRTLLRTSE